MSQFRKNLRQNLKTHLINQTQAEGRVFVGRTNPLEEDQAYPVLLIFGEGEGADPITQGYSVYVRSYRVAIEIRVAEKATADGSEVEDKMDDISTQVEDLIKTFKMSGLKDILYTGSANDLDSESALEFGSLRMNFEFKYIL